MLYAAPRQEGDINWSACLPCARILQDETQTALMKASVKGHAGVVQLLLEAGANKEATTKVGRWSTTAAAFH